MSYKHNHNEKREQGITIQELLTPPAHLGDLVMHRIEAHIQRVARMRLAFVSGFGLISLGGLYFLGSVVVRTIAQSEFWQYISLFFSNGGDLVFYWKELMLSLVESMPLFGITSFFALVAFFLWTCSCASRDARIVFSHH